MRLVAPALAVSCDGHGLPPGGSGLTLVLARRGPADNTGAVRSVPIWPLVRFERQWCPSALPKRGVALLESTVHSPSALPLARGAQGLVHHCSAPAPTLVGACPLRSVASPRNLGVRPQSPQLHRSPGSGKQRRPHLPLHPEGQLRPAPPSLHSTALNGVGGPHPHPPSHLAQPQCPGLRSDLARRFTPTS